MRDNQAQIETGQTLVYFDGRYVRDPATIEEPVGGDLWSYSWAGGRRGAVEENLFNITTEEGISSLVAAIQEQAEYMHEMTLKYDHVAPSGEIHPTMFEAMKIFMPK